MRALFVALIALGTCTGSLRAEIHDASGVVYVTVDGPRDSVTVGQRFPVAIHVSSPDSLTPIVNDKIDGGDCRVLSFAWRETRAEGRLDRVGDAVMVPVALDSVAVPPIAFDFTAPNGDTLRAWSEGFEVPLTRIALTSEDLRPLKSQWEVPPDYVKWAAIALAVIALAALIIWWVRRRRARIVVVEPKVVIPPDVIALAELDRIATLGLVERGEFKSYYTLVTDCVRRYIGARYGVETMDRTTHELLDELSRRDNTVAGLGALLDEADLVKFAKLKPEAPTAMRALENARVIVVSTRPRTETPAAEVATGTEA